IQFVQCKNHYAYGEGVRDVVFVIQSQKNSYHTHRAEQKRTELLHQAQTLNQVSSPDVVLLHKLSDSDGNWSIPSEWFLGRHLHDDEPTIIHDYAFSEDPYSFTYPDFMAGWALSCPLAKRTAERVNYEPPELDFTIDLQHEIALYIWEEGRGPALTAVNEFCSELHSLSSTEDCAMTVNTLSACVSTINANGPYQLFREIYTSSQPWHCAKTFAILKRFASGAVTKAPWLLIVDDDTLIRMVFSRVAVQNILAGGCSCRSLDAPDDMVIGMCLTTLGLQVTHSPLFHQVARFEEYSHCFLLYKLLGRQSPISFHKHWNINPVAVYQHWLTEPNLR
uniref:Beta 3-glucosyltransferase b n=1 Tax=Sinocyclocheilus rhinocerous TaxID=307959 RepID=A0A673MI07_9TELE